MSTPAECPECKSDLTGDPIPQEFLDKGYYGDDTTHYSRVIGIEDPDVYDGISWWECPDCKHIWKRFLWSPDYNREK
jgi:hypothetical protein